MTSVADAAENAAYIIVAVKPADVESVLVDIAEAAARAENASAEQVFVTVAAGVSTAYYESKLARGGAGHPGDAQCPVVVGGGVSALARGRFATAEQLKDVAAIFDAVGGVLTVPESQLDAVTAVSGSGPAYFFLMVEALVDAGVAAGLPRGVATELVSQTMAGSAAMLLERLDEQHVGRRRSNGFGHGYQRGAVARHRDVAGWHHRRWAAGTRAGWPARGGRRRGGRRKNTL